MLTFHKRVKGLKVRQRGRRRCVPQTQAAAAQAAPLGRQPGGVPEAAAAAELPCLEAGRRDPPGGDRRGNEIVWNGRVAGRRLSPGLYQARLRITDVAGNVSRAERLRFRVQRRRR